MTIRPEYTANHPTIRIHCAFLSHERPVVFMTLNISLPGF